MTIAYDRTAGAPAQGSQAQATLRSRHGLSGGHQAVPTDLLEDRLERQIAAFERAGYRLETRAGLQAIVIRHRPRNAVRDVLLPVVTLGLLPLLTTPGRPRSQRVAITVDRSAQVRFVNLGGGSFRVPTPQPRTA